MNSCIIDFETSGIDVFKDYPIEIGAILVSDEWEKKREFHSQIKPWTKRSFSASAFNTHAVESAELFSSPTQKEVLCDFFSSFGTDFRFAGWNINFDVSFFRRMCHNNNMMREYNRISYRHIDIQSIAYHLGKKGVIPESLNSLDKLVHFFSIKRSEKHNALEDAQITLEVYKLLSNL